MRAQVTSHGGDADVDTFPFEMIPRRVFLDTNVIDCLVKWSECIFENIDPPESLPHELESDILSLRHVFVVGSRALWDIVVSSGTIEELSNTRDAELRNQLVDYGVELVGYGSVNGTVEEDRAYARDFARRVGDSAFLEALPHAKDRELVAHAVALGCDCFCTRDLRSIHRKRHLLRQIPLRILTPNEWWLHIRPWAALWC